jgi:hypothetical protein
MTTRAKKTEPGKQEPDRGKKLRLTKETLRDLADRKASVKGGVVGTDTSARVTCRF